MRVFSQINNCQQKSNKQTNKQNKKGLPLLGLAKSIYYHSQSSPKKQPETTPKEINLKFYTQKKSYNSVTTKEKTYIN